MCSDVRLYLLQSIAHIIDASRIAAPVRKAGDYSACPGLTPTVQFDEVTWIVRVQELAAIPDVELREHVGTLINYRDALERALDILIDGV